jgi:hypothetical protein
MDLGLPIIGGSEYAGHWLIQFTAPHALNGVFTEWIEASPHHLNLKDDGSPLDRLSNGSMSVFGSDLAGSIEQPPSGVIEVGIFVEALELSIDSWAAVTGHDFSTNPDGMSAVSASMSPRIRLVASAGEAGGGFAYAEIGCADTVAKRAQLEAQEVPLVPADDRAGVVEVAPDYLNGFPIRFRSLESL